MSIEDRLFLVRLAEVDAEAARVRAHDAVNRLRESAKATATPWRIVTVGAISGYLAGRGRDGPAGGPSVGGRLFATIAQAMITTLGASATAGVAASSAADAAADATVKATTEVAQSEPLAMETGD